MVDVKSTGLYSKDKILLENNCETIYWKTGHSHIKRKVNTEKALAGFEKSGHFFFNQPLGYGYDDGINSAIHICHLLDNQNKRMSDIIRELPPFIMPNTGNMGLPICLFAYGSQGLGVAAAISALIILSHFTLGIFLAARKFNFDVILKSPPFYTIIISVFLLYFEIKTPVFIENTTFLLMYATIFLILMSLGIALTRFKVFSFKKALASSIGRVIAGPIVGFLLIRYFNLTGFAAGVLLIQCSMPSAVLNYLVASIYSPKKIIDSVASTIVVSTLMSFITIPIVVFFALKYFN